MTRINTNVSSLVAQNRLNKTNSDLQTSLTRLSTGLRINSGKDDPAGLIASEALRSDITSINKAISNTQRASQIIATADSALGQVSSLLNDVRGLVVEAANKGALSDDEIAANQLQIDSSLEAINRIAQTTTFQGRRLLDGSLDFVTKAGTGFGSVKSLKIDQANLGAVGQMAVDIKISSAATRATVSSSGIPVATTPVNSAGTINFSAPSPADEAKGTASFAAAYTVGAEASGTISLASAWAADAEATGTVTLTGGAAFDVTAKDGTAVDGTKGNVTVTVTTSADPGSTAGTYDAATNTLALVLEEGQTGTQVAAALALDTNVNALFDFNAGNATAVGASDTLAAPTTLAGGTDFTGSSFVLSAVNGGAADGALGNATKVVLTSGSATGASYDADNNQIILTAASGATVSDLVAAINTDLSADFKATNTVNGSRAYSITDNTTLNTPLSNGTDPVAAGQFDIEAVNGGLADGTAGNGATLNITRGTATEATYDADNNVLNITLADGATIADVATAIDTEGTFVTKNVLNGSSLFADADLGVNNPTLAAGTDSTADDVITVTADDPSASFDGRTISVSGDNSLAAGTASAAVDSDGNIVVKVSSLGSVALGTIASAVNDLEGFSASVTGTDGDGAYDVNTDTAATTTALAGGVFGGGLNADLVVRVTGASGAEVFQFQKGASLDDVIQSINLVKDATGVSAENDSGALKLNSLAYGSEGLVDVEVISEGEGGTFKSGLTASRKNGTDIAATVNGTAATGKGNVLSLNTATLDLSVTVTEGSSDPISFTITGGGAQFQLGPEVVSNQQARLGIGSLNTAKLGGASGMLFELANGGAKSLVNDPTGASRVVDEAINQVTGLRGRLGAFQATTLESNLVSLNETVANLTEAESSIRDADFAAESARLTRAQILVQSGTSVLGIANQNPQNVLSLLR